jgi:hypothetical protein
MSTLASGCLIALFYFFSFSLCSECNAEYEWLTLGATATREYRVFNDEHPFFNGTKPTGKIVSNRYDNTSEDIVSTSLFVGAERYLYTTNASKTSVRYLSSGLVEYSQSPSLPVMLSTGYAVFSIEGKTVKIFRVTTSPESISGVNFNMDDNFDWSNMVYGGEVLSSDTALFLWGNEFDNRSLLVDLKQQNMTPGENVATRWQSDRSKFAVWQEGSLYHAIWSIANNDLTYSLTHSTFFPYAVEWTTRVTYYPLYTLYHSRADVIIYLDQNGIQCLEPSTGNLTWSFPVPTGTVKQLAASDRKENGYYLYFTTDTTVTFLEFDGEHVEVANKFSPSGDVIQALSVLHGDDEGEEIIFVSGTTNAFYAVSIDGTELFRASGNQCMTPVIFRENSTFICADNQGVRFFSFESSASTPGSDDGGGLAPGWIAFIVIGSIVAVAVVLGVIYLIVANQKKSSGPEMIF